MSAPFTLRYLTVDEVCMELRSYCVAYGFIQKRDAVKIRLELPIEELPVLCHGDDDWDEFLPYLGLSLPELWWAKWESPLTIRELCTDLASRIRVPVSEPVTILGNRCEMAGMFFVMKRLLAEGGADTSGVGPSTPIADYAERHPDVFCRSRLGRRGRLPAPRFDGVGLGCVLSLTAGITLGLLAHFGGSVSPSDSCLIAILSGMSGALISRKFSRRYHRHPVSFRGIVTFRDFIHAAFDRPAMKAS